MAKKRSGKAAGAAAAKVGDPNHYEGKRHYPKAIYRKAEDGTVESLKVESPAAHAEALKVGAYVDHPDDLPK